MSIETKSLETTKPVQNVSGITVRLCGDSGDGMQLLGTQLTNTSALAGNDIATFPDFPAEIRAHAVLERAFLASKSNSLPTKFILQATR